MTYQEVCVWWCRFSQVLLSTRLVLVGAYLHASVCYSCSRFSSQQSENELFEKGPSAYVVVLGRGGNIYDSKKTELEATTLLEFSELLRNFSIFLGTKSFL